ncbi:MAG: hypothetical protein ABJN69_14115 [Hellea sp.]
MRVLFVLKLKVVLLSIFLLPLFACASLNKNDVEALSPSMLSAASEKFAGKSIFLRGYVVLGTNARCLYETKTHYAAMKDDYESDFAAFKNNYIDYKITLLNPHVIWTNREKLDGEMITLKGKFINDYDYENGNPVDLQACSTNALVIDEEYLKVILSD